MDHPVSVEDTSDVEIVTLIKIETPVLSDDDDSDCSDYISMRFEEQGIESLSEQNSISYSSDGTNLSLKNYSYQGTNTDICKTTHDKHEISSDISSETHIKGNDAKVTLVEKQGKYNTCVRRTIQKDQFTNYESCKELQPVVLLKRLV